VLGPLVFGACLVDRDGEQALISLGVRDSKKLSTQQRADMRLAVPEIALQSSVLALEPHEIDAENLGVLGKRAIVELALRHKPDVLVLDAPVAPSGIPRFVTEIRRRLAAVGLNDVLIVAENKADDNHPCCAAASILAKTYRDERLADLQALSPRVLGSGYPSDPKTQRFLRDVWSQDGAFPPFVRTKWETVQRLMAESRQGELF
jgi:ribonuclease HII